MKKKCGTCGKVLKEVEVIRHVRTTVGIQNLKTGDIDWEPNYPFNSDEYQEYRCPECFHTTNELDGLFAASKPKTKGGK